MSAVQRVDPMWQAQQVILENDVRADLRRTIEALLILQPED
jgi:hypothetical protein